MTVVQPAATVVLIRDGRAGLEALLLRRNSRLAFAGGSWVFPGGRIDDLDGGKESCEEVAARLAAVREAREETGLYVDPDSLLYFAHWTTPEPAPRRFATWFFVSDTFSTTQVEVDGSEIVDHLWVAPAQALEKHHERLIELLPPTFITLQELSGCEDVASAMQMYRRRDVQPITPRVGKTDEGVCMLYPGDAGYESCDALAAGKRHRFWMVETGWRYEVD